MANFVISSFVVRPPTLENYFNILVECDSGPLPSNWVNPYLSTSSITCYVPPNHFQLIQACQKKYEEDANLAGIFPVPHEILSRIFCLLEMEDLFKFSETCKCNYYVSKVLAVSDGFWNLKLTQLLPHVHFKSRHLCNYSPEQQFKIICKKIHMELKPYIAKFERNNQVLREICGSTGKLYQAWQAFLKAEKLREYNQTRWMYLTYNLLRTDLAGPHYRDNLKNFDPLSEQGRLLDAINKQVIAAFDQQTLFEKVINDSENVKTRLYTTQ